jgi:hypothetical protein
MADVLLWGHALERTYRGEVWLAGTRMDSLSENGRALPRRWRTVARC